jgi:hypothetical protein
MFRRCAARIALTLVVGACVVSTPARADDAGLLCGVVRDVLATTQGMQAAGVQAELTTVLAERLEYDGERLLDARLRIDEVASAQCADERTQLLARLGMSMLRDAF